MRRQIYQNSNFLTLNKLFLTLCLSYNAITTTTYDDINDILSPTVIFCITASIQLVNEALDITRHVNHTQQSWRAISRILIVTSMLEKSFTKPSWISTILGLASFTISTARLAKTIKTMRDEAPHQQQTFSR